MCWRVVLLLVLSWLAPCGLVQAGTEPVHACAPLPVVEALVREPVHAAAAVACRLWTGLPCAAQATPGSQQEGPGSAGEAEVCAADDAALAEMGAGPAHASAVHVRWPDGAPRRWESPFLEGLQRPPSSGR